jgi:hypothetical protein
MRAISICLLVLIVACSNGPGTTAVNPEIDVAPRSLDFGKVYAGHRADLSIEISYRTALPVNILEAHVEGGRGFVLGAVPEKAREVQVGFAPSQAGAATATLVLENDSQNEPEVRIPLTGEGLAVPDCDDHDPCTSDDFDVLLVACVHAPLDGTPCDDHDACTRNDTCAKGVCKGEAVDCDDSDQCTLDLCDPVKGCVHQPDPTVCDDGDPCTLDYCDKDNGCTHPTAPDGTQCGPLVDCTSIQLCVFGGCRQFAVPEGFPCNDQDSCTENDACHGGVCAGTRVVRDAQIESTAHTFGGYGSRVLPMPGGQVIFADDPSDPWSNTPTQMPTSVTVALATDTGLSVLKNSTWPAGSFYAMWPMTESRFLALHHDVAHGSYTTQIIQLHPDGTLEGQGTLPSTSGWTGSYAISAAGSTIFDCRSGSSLDVFDATDPSTVARVASLSLGDGFLCWRASLNSKTGRLLLLGSQGSGTPSLLQVDVASPADPKLLGPVQVDTVSLTGMELGPDALVLAYATDPCCYGWTRLEVRDPATYALMSSIDYPLEVRRSVGLAFSGHALLTIVLADDHSTYTLTRYSLTDLTHPAITDEESIEPETESLIASGGVAAVWGIQPRLFRVVADQPGIKALTHESLGGALRVVSHEAKLFAFDARSAHEVQVDKDGASRVVAGASLPASAGQIFRFGDDAGGETVDGWGWAFRDPATVSTYSWLSPVEWVDASDPWKLTVASQARFGDQIQRQVRASGQTLWSVTVSSDWHSYGLERFDLKKPTDVLTPSARIDLPGTVSGYSYALPLIAPDPSGKSVAVSVPATRMLFVARPSADGLELMGQGSFAYNIASLAVSGSAIAALDDTGTLHLLRIERR